MTHSVASFGDSGCMWLNKDEQKRALENKIIKKLLNQFISKMAIPCFGRLQYYYYYDVLELLSRHLFQMLLTKKKTELEEEEAKSSCGSLGSDAGLAKSNSLSSSDDEFASQ